MLHPEGQATIFINIINKIENAPISVLRTLHGFLLKRWYNQGMDKSITRFASLSDMRDAQLRDWQSRPGHERIAAISEVTTAAYALKKGEAPYVSRLQRTFVKIKRTQS